MMASFSLLSSSVGFFGSPKMTATSVSSFSSTSRKNVDLQKRWVNAQPSKISYYRDRDRDMSTMKKMQVGVNKLVDAVGGLLGPKRHNLVVMSSKNGSPKTVNNGFSAIKEVVDRELAASSLGYNYEIGNMVAEAFSKVGSKGAVVTLKGGKHAAKDDSLYLVEGMQFDCGYFLPYFVTNSEEMSFDLENCKLLLVDKIGNAKDLASVLKDAIQGGYPISIIAEDIQREALDAFLASRPLGAPKIAVLKTFGFWGGEGNFLDDIAVLTGATVIREEAGLTLENVESEVLGFAAKVVVADGGTTIVGDGSTKESLNREAEKIRELVLAKETAVKKINGPAQSIKEIFQEASLNGEIKCLDKRLVRLSERVAVIEVGAETEKEVEEKKQRFDVALNKIKVLSSDDPNYDYNVAPKKTVVEECVDKIVDIIDAGGFLDPMTNVDELLFNIEMFTVNMLSYDDIKAERLLDSINSVEDLVLLRYIDLGNLLNE